MSAPKIADAPVWQAPPRRRYRPLSPTERAKRMQAHAYANASVAMEGYVLGPEYQDLVERFVDGEFSLEEFQGHSARLASLSKK